MACSDKALKATARWRVKNPRHIRHNTLMWRYKMTIDEYEELLTKQNNVCAICLEPEVMIKRGKIQALSVDHNHTTGKVRGLLCARCNIMIGAIEDNPIRSHACLLYLEKHNG